VAEAGPGVTLPARPAHASPNPAAPDERLKAPAARRPSIVWWRVRESNPRMRCRLIYSQLPLATWVTRQVHTRPACTANRGREYQAFLPASGCENRNLSCRERLV